MSAMLRLLPWLLLPAILLRADTIELKDRASITGTILAEKKDQVVMDLGFSVITVPRAEVLAIRRADRGATATNAPAAPAPAAVNPSFLLSSSAARERTVRELVDELGAAVVQVRTPSGSGSGFFINEEGYLVTNFHVVENETRISVDVYQLRQGQWERKTCKDVRIVALNKFHDLALLRVEDKGAGKFPAVPLSDPDRINVGERVFAIGSPLGLERTVTEGIVSSKTRELAGNLYLQTTAQINPGNSGGPLFNLRGEVAGVTNMKLAIGEGLGFAIPADIVAWFVKNREAFAFDNDNPAGGFRYLEPPSRARPTPPTTRPST